MSEIDPFARTIPENNPVKKEIVYFVKLDDNISYNFISIKVPEVEFANMIKLVGFFILEEGCSPTLEEAKTLIQSASKDEIKEIIIPITKLSYIQNLSFRKK